jgi:hypothetical protein
MRSDTVTYCHCMEEVKQRIGLVKAILAGLTTTGQEIFNIELIFVQLRKILELIAFASLTANKVKYSAAHANFASHWRAKGMLADLGKINPDFFPVPLDAPVPLDTGVKHFPRPVDGFLTKDEFVTLYDASSAVIHSRNPFSTKDPVIQIGYSVEEWVLRIQKLLGWHLMHLVDGDKWVVNIPQDGPVQVYPASPKS